MVTLTAKQRDLLLNCLNDAWEHQTSRAYTINNTMPIQHERLLEVRNTISQIEEIENIFLKTKE